MILQEQVQFKKYESSAKEDSPEENSNAGRDKKVESEAEIRVVVGSDHMTAWIEHNYDNARGITLNQIKAALTQSGIINGVYPDTFIQCFMDAGMKKFPGARVDCSNILKRESTLSFYIADENGKPIEKKKGEVLTEQATAVIEVPVENLYGENITAEPGNNFAVRCGVNTRWSRDGLKIHAAKSGTASLSAGRRVYIHPTVHILDDADNRYGPVESYANLTVSGVVTGAFSITAGKVSADEIRGANINAIGDIHARVGITDAVIRTQGDVHARYVRNSRIETFGNIYIQNEIIDSLIRCSGKLDSPTCRIVTSKIYAKCGVRILGAGSIRAVPSTIVAGGEHHAVGLVSKVMDAMNSILGELEALKEEKQNVQFQSDTIFKKMIELKTFHDRAKKKKAMLLSELNKKKETIDKKTLANIQKLISTYDKRMNNSLLTLKTMNATKKEHDENINALKEKISLLSAKTQKEILSHEKTLFAYLEKSKERIGVPVIEIKGTAFSGTNLGGVYQVLHLAEDKNNFKIEESWHQGMSPELKFVNS